MAACNHRPKSVKVGEFEVYATGTDYMWTNDLDGFDLIVPLTPNGFVFEYGKTYRPLFLPDFGGVTSDWQQQIEAIITLLQEGKKIVCFCFASHGRTGTFLASLIALLEPGVDPLDAVRERHCSHAVETKEQLKAIYALLGEKVPMRHRPEFENK